MSSTRIKDIQTTASAAANDDYIALDGATNGTRKMLAGNIGGTTYTLSITSNVLTLTGSDGSTSTATLPVYSGGVS